MTAAAVKPPIEMTGRRGGAPALDLRLEVLRDWDAVARIEREWDALAVRTGADISLCPAYARTWWNHYGRGELRIMCVWANDGAAQPALVGVIPMFIQRILAGPIPVRLARVIATDSTITVTRIPVETGHAPRAYQLAVDALVGDDRCDAVHLGPMQGDDEPCGLLRQSCQGLTRATASERTLGVCTRFQLPGTFDEYMASLEKRQRGNLRRDLNQIAKTSPSRTRVITDPDEADAVFTEFVSMHALQWRAEGRPGHFGDWPGSQAFSRECIRALSPMGRVTLVGLEIDGKTACWEWCYTLGGRCFWKLPARQVGDEWNKLGLGRLGMVNMLRSMMERGVRDIEAGPGHYDYKCKHGATEHPLVSFLIVRRSGMSKLKARCLERYADFVHLAYYRAWRLKLAPRVGMGSAPLSRLWIRSRV